jgi:hypothetical protein
LSFSLSSLIKLKFQSMFQKRRRTGNSAIKGYYVKRDWPNLFIFFPFWQVFLPIVHCCISCKSLYC